MMSARRFCPRFYFEKREAYFPINSQELFNHILIYTRDLQVPCVEEEEEDKKQEEPTRRLLFGHPKVEDLRQEDEKLFLNYVELVVGPASVPNISGGHTDLSSVHLYTKSYDRTTFGYFFVYGLTVDHGMFNLRSKKQVIHLTCVRIQLTDDLTEIKRMWLQTSNAGDGYWINGDELAYVPGTTRPVLYIARHTHAFYHRSGVTCRRGNWFTYDYCSPGLQCDPVIIPITENNDAWFRLIVNHTHSIDGERHIATLREIGPSSLWISTGWFTVMIISLTLTFGLFILFFLCRRLFSSRRSVVVPEEQEEED